MIGTEGGSLRKAIDAESNLVLVAVEGTALVQELLRRQDCYPPALIHLGQAALAALLVQALGDGSEDEKVQLQWLCEGAFGNLYAESLGRGKIRGTIAKPQGGEDLKESLGPGLFQVRRSKEAGVETSTGIVKATGRVGDDIVEYLLVSEQRSCGVALSVQIAWDESRPERPFRVERAIGYLVHVLPQVQEARKNELLLSMDRLMRDLGPLSKWVLPEAPEEATRTIFDFLCGPGRWRSVVDQNIRIFCTCSEERAARAVSLLSATERAELSEDDGRPLKIVCEFCGARYELAEAG